VAVDGGQRLLQLIQSNRESSLVRACRLARDHVDDSGGGRSHVPLDIVDPSVDLHLLFKARAAAEHGISAGQIARNRQTVSNNHATCFAIFKHGKASSERLLAQCRILGPHMHGLKALNLHKLGREAYQLGLWRRRTIAPSGRVEFHYSY